MSIDRSVDYQKSPHIKCIFTDIFAGLNNFQNNARCWKRELQLVDCLEAYGPQHAATKCAQLMENLRECVLQSKQKHRLYIMRAERDRQVSDGERSEENRYADPPPLDTY